MTPTEDLIDVDHRFGGWIESSEDKTFGSAFPDSFLVPRDEWRDRIHEREEAGHSLKNYHPYVYNQHPESSCVYNAAAGCLTIRRNIQLGEKWQVVLSPMSGYGQVARYRHSGSTMWGALGWTSEHGLLPSDRYGGRFPHEFHENRPFDRRLPDGWEDTARHFRAIEWFRVDSREQFASALLHDMPICYGRSGHSICAEDLIYDTGRRRFYVRYCDSYGLGRGDDGRLYDSERMWATGGAWACRQVTQPDDPATFFPRDRNA